MRAEKLCDSSYVNVVKQSADLCATDSMCLWQF